jgi:hypothetical protein
MVDFSLSGQLEGLGRVHGISNTALNIIWILMQ